ncbi:MAG: hypothetical protein ACD_28C00252G0002 [uncultured bacterium]|nr:MAG: hypothetical protein ACD_28C00252G0002 [uncultured bacterium]
MKTNFYKKTLTIGLLTLTLLFAGCFGGEDGESDPTSPTVMEFFRLVESDSFTIQVPEDWETRKDFPSGYPQNTVVAFVNNIKENEFIANINIVKNEVPEGTLTQDYALKVMETLSNQLLEFKEIKREETTIKTGNTEVKTYFFEFQGTNDTTMTPKRFLQSYAVKGTEAYIITATYDTKDTELAVDQLRQSIGTFEVK